MVLERVRDYIRKNAMVAQGDTVLVAVSGGPDSLTLLHLLHRLSGEFGLTLHVFHLDHGLRGEASDADARFVRDTAHAWGLPCTVIHLRPGELQAQPGSLEANARAARYAQMEAVARKVGANRIALGHNRDDQAETVLMRLLRGAGSRGLAGIPPVRAVAGLTYIRPLLGIPRGVIEQYCTEHELSPRLDQSNLEPGFLRNRIRLQLLPELTRTFNPSLAENLAQVATVLHDEDRLLDDLAAAAMDRCRLPGNGVALHGPTLLKEPIALARRVVRMAAREAMGPEFELGFIGVTQVLEAATNIRGTHQLDLAGGVTLRVEYGSCQFFADGGIQEDVPCRDWPLARHGETAIHELGIAVAVSESGTGAGPLEAAFDADRLPGPLAVRVRRPGDRLWPVGMTGSKKVQDILVDAKVPARLRGRIPLLLSGDEVIWVMGYRLDRRFLATPASRRRLLVKVVQQEAPSKN